jgi:hypothetical protein
MIEIRKWVSEVGGIVNEKWKIDDEVRCVHTCRQRNNTWAWKLTPGSAIIYAYLINIII